MLCELLPLLEGETKHLQSIPHQFKIKKTHHWLTGIESVLYIRGIEFHSTGTT